MPDIVKQNLCVKDKRIVEIDSVINVLSLDENSVLIDTNAGRIVIEGESLKINSLDKSTGKIELSGNINAVIYPRHRSKTKGLFK